MRVRTALEQPAVEDQQVGITALSTNIVLAAGQAAHPGFSPDPG
jgi:hypothetical protein